MPLWFGKLLLAGKDAFCAGWPRARDTLRFEAALPLYGRALTDITPLEQGLTGLSG